MADDEQEFASTLVSRLELMNLSVKMVGSGREEIEEVEREEPDVMLHLNNLIETLRAAHQS